MNTKILPVLISALLVLSCTEAPTAFPEYRHLSGVDFSQYSEKGFLFTPNLYGGDYKSVGLITLTYRPAANLIEIDVGRNEEVITYSNSTTSLKKEWVFSPENRDMLLEAVYETCIEMGADAFTQMTLSTVKVQMPAGLQYPLALTETTISGYAIKRLGAFKE